MKKLLLLTVFVLGAISFSQAQTRVGGGFSYGTDIEDFGLNLNGEFFVGNNVSITPGFTYFFTPEAYNFWDLNADAHFYFAKASSAEVYGLAGFNLATFSWDDDRLNDDSNTEVGLNLGVGSNFDLGGPVMPFVQMKLVLGGYDQGVLTFGIRVKI